MTNAFDDLMAHARQTAALSQVAGRLGWDQETVMPSGAATQRAEEMAAMESVLHARRSDPKVGDLLAKAQPDDEAGKAQVREITRDFERASKVPEQLATALAKETSLAQGVWIDARAKEDVAAFLPNLKTLIDLKREEASALAVGGDLYDALLDDFEPGATQAELTAMFDALRPGLVDLRARILGAPSPKALEGTFDEEKQLGLSQKLAKVFGYDSTRGRIDKAVHPFSSGSGQDVRITTRTALDDPFNCFYSTIHEVGHACYEQGVEARFGLTPLGHGASMGVHESQSRFYENQVGRSRGFTGWLYREMTDTFGELGLGSEEAFYAAVNRVSSGYIRTEADEVHYNLHVLLRYDLERDLISGALDVEDLEAAWNNRFEADFDVAVDKPSNGILQDVHWSAGLFGYFPTYTLGNVYAGCLNAALERDLGPQAAKYAQADVADATGWMAEKIHRFGALKAPKTLMAEACGQAPSEEPLLAYLNAKFSEIYDL